MKVSINTKVPHKLPADFVYSLSLYDFKHCVSKVCRFTS